MDQGKVISALSNTAWQEIDPLAAGPDTTPRACEGVLSTLGVTWELKTDDARAFHAMLDRTPQGAIPREGRTPLRRYVLRLHTGTEGDRFVLTGDDCVLASSPDLGEVLDVYEDDVNCLIAERSPRRVFLRAGVVGWHDRAILLPGGPGSGKTALVRALVARGATWYSDRYAVLEGAQVSAYPGRSNTWANSGMGCLVGDGCPRPFPVGFVVFPSYRPGAVWRPKLLVRGRALLAMLPHAVSMQRNPERVLRTLDLVSRKCHGLDGARGEAQTMAGLLLDRLV
jgi:hypothetical protein